MCFTRNRGRGKSSLTALVLLILGGSARAREPLVPHRIKDMILVGREGTSKSTVSRLESAGKHAPSLSSMKRYAEAVGCKIEIKLIPQR